MGDETHCTEETEQQCCAGERVALKVATPAAAWEFAAARVITERVPTRYASLFLPARCIFLSAGWDASSTATDAGVYTDHDAVALLLWPISTSLMYMHSCPSSVNFMQAHPKKRRPNSAAHSEHCQQPMPEATTTCRSLFRCWPCHRAWMAPFWTSLTPTRLLANPLETLLCSTLPFKCSWCAASDHQLL